MWIQINMIKLGEELNCNHIFANNKKIVVQKNKYFPIEYNQKYFDHYKFLETTKRGESITNERIDLVKKYSSETVLDIGIGCGSFVSKMKSNTYGYDVNQVGINWLKEKKIFLNPYEENTSHIKCWTFWDVLEHLPDPDIILNIIKPLDFLFISIPIFIDFEKLTTNKHFKPNEHFLYFTNEGLIDYLREMNFELLHSDDVEIKLGREDIIRYVFRKI